MAGRDTHETTLEILCQRRLTEMEAKGSLWGFVLFVLVFQTVQSACSLWGYAAALTRRGLDWKR